MRQIVLDTETTGLEPSEGHRMIELGCVELLERRPTRRNLHHYLQPDRSIESGAAAVHGITDEFLADKPRFADIAEEMIAYLRGAELIIHNAAFDVGFLDHELRLWRADAPRIEELCTVVDTLAMGRRMHPGQRNSLDALCRRYEVDNTRRELHGALLDAEILADVYLAMTGGQAALRLGTEAQPGGHGAGASGSERTAVRRRIATERPRLAVIHASEAELELHAERLAAIDEASGGGCVWRTVSPAP